MRTDRRMLGCSMLFLGSIMSFLTLLSDADAAKGTQLLLTYPLARTCMIFFSTNES